MKLKLSNILNILVFLIFKIRKTMLPRKNCHNLENTE